jgi:iron complex outermembrane receptor protein
LVALLFLPASVLAQSELAISSDQPAARGQTGNNRPSRNILDLDIEQLGQTPVIVPSMDIPVTSVTKEQSTVGRSAAAIFVITNEMIRRSGATCIPEALRMSPGLDVAQINSNTWAISSRGFNGIWANKLLVLIDGRTVYLPVSSGVYWDEQDVLLEDVDRIEVIRGPGGTLWGANAVNGVINIITKKAGDTQGAYVSVGGGTVERSNEAVRYGGQIGDDCHYRIYGKYFDRGPFFDPNLPANDGWNQGRVGFRTDWDMDRSKTDSLTVQGDHYVGTDGQDTAHTLTTPPFSVLQQGHAKTDGQNVLMRWRHIYDERSDWELQSYYDDYERITDLISERAKTLDIDFHYRFPLGDRHQITSGAGYRYIHYETPDQDPFSQSVVPPEDSLYVVSQFIQDEITLSPDLLGLTLGCKLEENNYTGLEYQPTARLLWTPDRQHSAWGAVSRAVRMPNPIDRGLFATIPPDNSVFPRVLGNPGFQSEVLFAYEAGYRTQATDQFSWDIATFYNVYDQLRTQQVMPPPHSEDFPPPTHDILPIVFTNGARADTCGVELATNWAVSERWRLYTEYTLLRMFAHGDLTSGDAGDSPSHQVYLHSSWNLRKDVDFDLMARYVDCLTSLDVPSYITMDLRLAWRPRKHLELAMVGQNLLQTYHYEFGQSTEIVGTGWEVTEVPRGVYGTLTWRR